jgi:hypothetical protein
MRLPVQHPISFALSLSLFTHFIVSSSDSDYENAFACLDKTISSQSARNDLNPYVALAFIRSNFLRFSDSPFVYADEPQELARDPERTPAEPWTPNPRETTSTSNDIEVRQQPVADHS